MKVTPKKISRAVIIDRANRFNAICVGAEITEEPQEFIWAMGKKVFTTGIKFSVNLDEKSIEKAFNMRTR